MTLIAAVVSICVAGLSCDTRAMRIEPKACHLGTIHAEVDVAGSPQPTTIKIACEGK